MGQFLFIGRLGFRVVADPETGINKRKRNSFFPLAKHLYEKNEPQVHKNMLSLSTSSVKTFNLLALWLAFFFAPNLLAASVGKSSSRRGGNESFD